jgi:Hypothetical protein
MSFGLQRSYSANMTDYCYIPPIAGQQQVKPNVLIVMDFSGSMNESAYTYSRRYDQSKTYYGYFDPSKCYTYNVSLGAFQENSCNCSNKIGTSTCISGNLLNWITATRIDLAKWVLTGGRTSSSGGNTFLVSEGYGVTIHETNLGCRFDISTFATTDRRLTISGAGCPISITNARIWIRPSDPSSIKGIIHSFCDTSDPNGRISEKCQIIMGFMVFSGGRTGVIRVGKNDTISSLIGAINNEISYGSTPTGEALWEAYDYYVQSNDHTYASNSAYINRGNANADPYYDGSGRNSIPVPCRKGFVLLISDGAWNRSVDPVVPARIMATQDLRTDLPGKQNVYTYAVYAFGDEDPDTALQGRQATITTAIFGGFDDKDRNEWPYPFTNIQYPNGSGTCSTLGSTVRTNIRTPTTTYCNSRGIVYPLPQCNPSGTWDSQCAEWDTAFNSPKDGLPYNFYEANDALTLRSALLNALTDILRRASSGATVATLTSRTSTSSLIVQPYYYPKYIRQDGTEVSWIGFLRSFWIDTMQNLREDTTEPKVLNVLNIAGGLFDKIFQFFFDPNTNETKAAILQGSNTTTSTSCRMEITKSINQLIPVFDAGCQLAKLG